MGIVLQGLAAKLISKETHLPCRHDLPQSVNALNNAVIGLMTCHVQLRPSLHLPSRQH